MHRYSSVHVCVYGCVCMYACVDVWMCAWCACIYIHIYIYTHVCVCIHINTYMMCSRWCADVLGISTVIFSCMEITHCQVPSDNSVPVAQRKWCLVIVVFPINSIAILVCIPYCWTHPKIILLIILIVYIPWNLPVPVVCQILCWQYSKYKVGPPNSWICL